MTTLSPLEFDELESTLDIHTEPTSSEFIGDIMTEYPSQETTRIYFQNINGLRWDADAGKWPYICEVIESINADVACFVETNTNTNNYTVRQKMEATCQHHFQQSRLILSSSKHSSTSMYKPGGTAILARNAITARIKSHTRDRMGRWASISFETSPTKRMRIISAYQVGLATRPGTNTAAAQQRAQIITEQSKECQYQRRTPRDAFIHDLQFFIRQVQSEGEDIILVGDFNEEMSSPTSGMDQLATNCGLADLFSIRLGTTSGPATYQRGPRRIDYALVSPALIEHVLAAGYDPFGYRIPTDHRAFYIDFATEAVFSQELTPLAPADKRDFVSTRPGTVATYVTAKMTYLRDHNFFDRLQRLKELGQPNHALAESLDKDFQRASTHAARLCRRPQQAPWSPKLAEAWAELHYYRLTQTTTTLPVNLQEAIAKLQRQWPHLPQLPPTDPEVIRTGYRNALNKLKEARLAAKALREEYLERKATLYAALDEKGKSKAVKRLIRAETQHKVYKKIRHLRNQDGGLMGLTTLKIPRHIPITETNRMKEMDDTPDHWETITVPEDIERTLLQRNQHHFGQAAGTPFTHPPLEADIGYKADGFAADLILSGDYHPEISSQPATHLFIQHLQARTLVQLEGQVTAEEVRNKLKRWKESTSTSPSGLHLGHYHCLWRDPQMDPAKENRQDVIDHQVVLLNCLVGLLNYALKFGYTYTRWLKVVNVMLQKDSGNPRIHRLRVIHIYEADYNLLLALKWRQAIHHAEDNLLLNDGLYGSRPGRSAHDPALIEVLQHEIYRMSMKPGINFDLDATSCYDRILPNLAAICSRRVGVARSVARMNTNMLEQAKYHLKTSLGISSAYYQHCETKPIYGTGQGSGNSPSIWCFVCSVLFDAFASQAHGATFTDYHNCKETKLFMIGFVDDCTQRVNTFKAENPPSTTQLITLMQQDAQLWNDLLWASGGALEQQKCSFHLIQSSWNADGHPFLTGSTEGQSIQLTHQGHVTPTHQKSNYTAHKTLGCLINPSYTNAQAFSALQEKNHSLTSLLETNCFSRNEARTLYTSIYLPSITYSLPITPLTKAQCSALDCRLLRALLPRCGYNRNMARAIRYATFDMGGAGFKQLYVEQGALIIQQVFKYLNSPQTQIGQLLHMTISWTQAFLGTSQLFLTDITSRIPPAPPSILLDLRTFLQSINGQILLQTQPISITQRLRDRFIMDIALSQIRWNRRHVMQINACRRYLQAQTLSDITNMSGTRILPYALTGDNAPSVHTQRCARFNQVKPEQQAWRTWRRFLLTLSDNRGVLTTQLGPWTLDHSQLRHYASYVYDPEHDQLYVHVSGESYKAYQRFTTGTFHTSFNGQLTAARGYPTAVIKVGAVLRPQQNYITSDDQQTNLDWEYDLLQDVQELKTLPEINQHIVQGNIIICSDGSSTAAGGSFGFIIATKQGQRIARGKGPAPGAHSNSFRSESYGVLAALRWLYNKSRVITTNTRHIIHHYLDNKSVIRRIEALGQKQHPVANDQLRSEQDVINEILSTLHALPFQINLKWIKGHQDNDNSVRNLPLPAQLNCEADRAASEYNSTHAINRLTVPSLPSTPCQLLLHGQSTTSKFKHKVHEADTRPKLLKYLSTKYEWGQDTLSTIDWESFTNILVKYRDRWTTIVKHIHDISPTGHIAHRNNSHLPHECPACAVPHETNIHVIICPYQSRAQWRAKTVQKIRHYRPQESDPHLIDILYDGLLRVHHQLGNIQPNHYPARYTTLIEQQNVIGWDHLYKGRWSIQWSHIHDDFVQRHVIRGSILSGKSWVLGVGRLLLDQWLLLWKLRNEERHGKDMQEQNRIRQQIVTSELMELYTYKNKVCPADRSLFHDSVEDHLSQHTSLDVIEDWISVYKEAIKASAAQAQNLGIVRNRTLLEFPTFNPIARTSQQVSLTADLPAG